ncbi:DNA-binding NarL/FixJ family response regulator [Thermocatellispora tengchongensis]|uniref:DNA-binding NarL/FixJ family response regulator n=1 Tax=Thermocatellispora tengchongensis TaxID=1073253 RepID=A0A840PGB1_9ACTN|nr:response regulator transcription factor [Thermocatellispora tengchongensis]MBB5136983.1 DNA-binding NarL/FixJ family response regulator [Thermocatellispora tengchongensis]
MIRTLLVDDESLIRAGLRFILESAPDVEIVGEAEDGDQAVDAVRRLRPDVVLMDIRMPRSDGLAATEAIRELARPPAVVILTTFDTDEYVFTALEAGACGFLLKDTSPHDLIAAVRVAHAGDSMLSPRVTRRLIHRVTTHVPIRRHRDALARLEILTDREREVLTEVGLGRSNAEIAASLNMSQATVKSHISHLFTKLAVTNRVQVAIAAYRAGLVD